MGKLLVCIVNLIIFFGVIEVIEEQVKKPFDAFVFLLFLYVITREEVQDQFQNFQDSLEKLFDSVIELFTGKRGDFDCSKNKLTSLTEYPKKVKGDFKCAHNQLTSLKGCPKIVNGNFDCFDNQLTTLEGGPVVIKEDFICSLNDLTSLKGCPKKVNGAFICYWNPNLEDISDIPYDLKNLGIIHCPNIKIFPKHIKDTLMIALDEEVLIRLKEQSHLEIVEVEESKVYDYYLVTIRERSLS